MAKVSVTRAAAAIAEKLAQEMDYEFVDASLDKEYGASFLRIYVDREGGITVDDCEAFHRAFQPSTEIPPAGLSGSVKAYRIALLVFMFVVPLIAFIISQSNVMETMATSGIKE